MEGSSEGTSSGSRGVALPVQTLVHIGLEAVVITGVTVWLNKKLNATQEHVEHLSREFTKKLEEKDEIIEALIKKSNMMESALVSLIQQNQQTQQSYSPQIQFNPFNSQFQQPHQQFQRPPQQFQQSFQPQMQPFQQQHFQPQQQQHFHQMQMPQMFQQQMQTTPLGQPLQFSRPTSQNTPAENPFIEKPQHQHQQQKKSTQHKHQSQSQQTQPQQTQVTPVELEDLGELDDILKDQLGDLLFEAEETGVPTDDGSKKKSE